DPGPACYGRGGTKPTVTDANLVLGRLPLRLAGAVELDRGAAERALEGFDPAAVVDVVNAEMLRALRVVSVERGHDPAEFALVAFGGAGPLHACELADELGSTTVIVPEAAGVLSAVGLVMSDERRDSVRSFLVPLGDAGELPDEGEADLRYRGQSFELTIPLQRDLATAFHRAHDELYGFADRDREIELVAGRTARRGPRLVLVGRRGRVLLVQGRDGQAAQHRPRAERRAAQRRRHRSDHPQGARRARHGRAGARARRRRVRREVRRSRVG